MRRVLAMKPSGTFTSTICMELHLEMHGSLESCWNQRTEMLTDNEGEEDEYVVIQD